jgi:DNA-binding transcriptional LysR family regulator
MPNNNRFYYKKSRIQQLRGFCYTVQTNCSIRQASKKLNVEHTTVAVQIRSLEEDLGIKLFERTKNHRLKITKEGQIFYEMAVERLQSMEGLFDSFLYKLKKTNQNLIRIAGHNIVLSSILPKYIASFKKENPKIKFKLCNNSKQEAISKLIDNEVDFVIYPTQENEKIMPELVYQPFLDYEPVLIAHKSHPIMEINRRIEMKDIKKYQLLLVDKFTLKTSMKNWIKDYEVGSDFEFENATWEILKNMIKENIAISGFSKIYLNKEELNILKYKNIEHLFKNKLLFTIITKKNSFLKEKVKKLINIILKDKLLK